MTAYRTAPGSSDGRWQLGVCLTCSLALLLGLAAVLTSGWPAWLRGGLGLAGLMLLGVGGGLLVAHLILDQPRRPPATPGR